MDIKGLIGEATEYDKKRALELKKPKSWCKSISAFANTLGGTLIFGIMPQMAFLLIKSRIMHIPSSVQYIKSGQGIALSKKAAAPIPMPMLVPAPGMKSK